MRVRAFELSGQYFLHILSISCLPGSVSEKRGRGD